MSKMEDRFSVGRLSISWQVRVLLILLVVLSFAVRLYDLEGKSLWSDEGLTLRRAEQPLGLVLENVNLIPIDPDYQDDSGPETFIKTPDLHPPLYFVLMHVWIQLAGKSEFALRFPSVVAATLAVPLVYALARSLLSPEVGLWAALLASLSPFYLWYAQEARMYSWLVVLSLTSVYLFLPLLEDKPRRRDYVAYVVASLALLYTHYAGFLLLGFEIVVYALYRLRARGRKGVLILIVLTLAVLPLAPFLWRLLHMQAFSFTYRPLPTILREAWSSFSLGPTPSAVQPWWRLSPFLILVGVGALTCGISRQGRAWMVGLGYLILPVLAQYLLSLLKPNYMNPRHLMVVTPAWELLMAQGLATLRRWSRPSLLLALGLVLFLRGQASYDIFTSHHFWKDDVRGAAQYIEERAQPGDAIVLHHPVIRLTFDYYYHGSCPETAIPRYGNDHNTRQARETFAEWANRYERIWFMYGPPPTYFPHDFLPNWADEHLFKVRQQAFEAWWTYVGVAAYEDRAPTLDVLPADVMPLDETWGALRLIGLRAQDGTVGENAWLDLYWQTAEAQQSRNELPDEPLRLKIQLRDEANTVWYERAAEVLPLYTPAVWPSDRVVHTEVRLPLLEDTPPISYSLALEPIGFEGLRTIGRMSVNRSSTPDPAPRPIARFGDGVELLAVELQSDRFRAGYPLTGPLTWRADEAPERDYRLLARLVDRQGRPVTVNETTLSAAGFPTSDWLPGDRVAGRLLLALPADLPRGLYRVEMSLIDVQNDRTLPVRRWFGEQEWLALETVKIEAWPLITELPEGTEERMEQVEIAEKVQLRAYNLDRDGEKLTLRLYWQAEAPLEQNYHVFVHIAEPGQPPVADAGGVPVNWTRPTTSWREGEVITDEYVISLSGVQPDRYDLLVGFYDPQTGSRPKTVVEGNVIQGGYVILEEIDVE